jgi:hypothetical protein
LAVEQAHQRLADRQLGDGGLDVQAGLLPHGLGRGLDGLLVARREGAQGVLHPVAQLGQHAVGDVQRVLGHEIHAHALGPHQPHHQLDALDQHLGRLVEQQVGLVEEEHQLGLVGVADLGQLLEQLGQHPQQEGGVQARRDISLSAARMLMTPWPLTVCMKVVDVQHRLAEELVAALGLDLQQPALDGAHAGGADVAVLGGELGCVLAHVLQHGAQVLQVQQQQAVVVGDLEDDVQHAGLGLVQVEHAGQQQRAHVGDGGAHRVALLAEDVPQRGGAGHGGGRGQPALLQASASLPDSWPAWLMPVRSPLTSAMKTGTPMREKPSASFCSVTVLPVPVAPVIRPCRLARPGRKHSVAPFLAISSGSAMGVSKSKMRVAD